MKKRAEMNSGEILVIGIISLVFCMSLVFGHLVIIQNGENNFTSKEDKTAQYNISINNTDADIAGSNISQVNITLSAGFVLTNGTDWVGLINAAYADFSNNSATYQVLSWQNLTKSGLFNGSRYTNFSFNATAFTPGNYTINVTLLNSTAFTNHSFNVYINDTTAPTAVEFVSAGTGLAASANLSQNYIPINASVTDNGIIKTFNITLTNISSGLALNTSNFTSSATTHFLNFTGLGDGNYSVNATAVDSFDNSNLTSQVLIFTLDTVAPIVTLSCTPITVNIGNTITCTCAATDVGSGVSSTSSTANPSTSSTGTFTTTCTARDNAGNNATSNIVSYDVLTSDAAPGSGGGGTTYTKTYVVTDEQFTEGYTKGIAKNEKMSIKISGITHNIGITALTSTTATISIFSIPQEATLSIGDERRFDVDADNYYEIYVKLNKIESNKADITIKSIYEKVVTATEETATQEQQKQEAATTQAEGELDSKNLTWLWIVIIVVVVLIAGGIWYYKNRK